MLCVILTAVTVYAAHYISEEAEHECSGEGCAVCEELCRCARIINTIKAIASAAIIAVTTAACIYMQSCGLTPVFRNGETLVLLKIKLTD